MKPEKVFRRVNKKWKVQIARNNVVSVIVCQEKVGVIRATVIKRTEDAKTNESEFEKESTSEVCKYEHKKYDTNK